MALEGTGEAITRVGQTDGFAYLSDPRHAGEWFAGAGFAVEPHGPPREGQTWSFAHTPGTRRVLPVSAGVFEPPVRFVWRTQLGALRTNNEWELRFEPVSDADSGSDPATRLRLTIRLLPGPLGWLVTLPLLPRMRGILSSRAQTAVERAVSAVERHTGEKKRKPR